MKNLVYSSAICNKCGTFMESLYTHDYQACACGESFLDGGNSYLHYEGDLRLFHLYNTDPWWLIRKFKKRLNQRRNEWVAIENIDDEWLDAIISFYMDAPTNPYNIDYAEVVVLYLREKQYRNVEAEVF